MPYRRLARTKWTKVRLISAIYFVSLNIETLLDHALAPTWNIVLEVWNSQRVVLALWINFFVVSVIINPIIDSDSNSYFPLDSKTSYSHMLQPRILSAFFPDIPIFLFLFFIRPFIYLSIFFFEVLKCLRIDFLVFLKMSRKSERHAWDSLRIFRLILFSQNLWGPFRDFMDHLGIFSLFFFSSLKVRGLFRFLWNRQRFSLRFPLDSQIS